MKKSLATVAAIITCISAAGSVDAATIAELQMQLRTLTEQIATLQKSAVSARSAASCPNISRTVSRGSRGSDVLMLQRFLISQSLLSSESATGFFGLQTETAIKQWQSKNGIVSSGSPSTTGYGMAGSRTRQKMASACSQPVLPAMNPVISLPSQPSQGQNVAFSNVPASANSNPTGGTSQVAPASFTPSPSISATEIAPSVASSPSLATKSELEKYLRSQFDATITSPGAVIVLPSQIGVSEPALVILPDGSPLDVSKTKTAGLQEALNYARQFGWDIFIYGRGRYDIKNTGGRYNLSAPLRLESMQGKTIRIYDADLVFDGSVQMAGLHIDSTMMVDFAQTGKIEAPSAKYGVYFDPEVPHPLDGTVYGTRGNVASRFSFDTIVAKGMGIFVETVDSAGRPASLNGVEFAVNSVTAGDTSRIVHTLGDYVANIVVRNQKLMPRIPFTHDPFRPNAVVVMPPEPGALTAKVYLPDGSVLPTGDTHTQGLQEAINFAASHGKNLIVYGRGIKLDAISFSANGERQDLPGFNDGFYFIRKSLVYPSLNNIGIKFFNVTIDDGMKAASDTDALMRFTGASNVDFELTGQVVNRRGKSFKIEPQPGLAVNNSTFRFGTGGSAMLSTYFSPISNSAFYFNELVGMTGGAFQEADFGLQIMSPNGSQCFCFNTVEGSFIHGHEHLGVQIGHTAENAGQIHSNRISVNVSPDSAHQELGVQLWGKNNLLHFNVTGVVDRGITVDTVADANTITYIRNDGLEQVFNGNPSGNTVKKISWEVGGVSPLP